MRFFLTYFFLISIAIGTFAQSNTDTTQNKALSYIGAFLDTSHLVILPFSVSRNPFIKNYKEPIVFKPDLYKVEELFYKSLNTYYKDVLKGIRDVTIAKIMTSYKKQLIFATDRIGQRFVWINCMCQANDDYWKKGIPLVFDGGDCYFSLKINLTTGEYFDFIVNGNG